MRGLSLTDEQLAERILKLVKELPSQHWLTIKIRHEGSKELVRWEQRPIDKQPVKSED